METITDRAQALLQERIGSIRELDDCAQKASEAWSAYRAAESKLADAWTAATKAGWTAEELRKLGIAQPSSRRGGRPSGRKASAPKKPKQEKKPTAADGAAGPIEQD